MGTQLLFIRRVSSLLIVTLILFQAACVGGHISPSTFQFTNVVPYTAPDGGGWKVAQVLVLLAKISPLFPETATCDIQVGVPEVNSMGLASDEFAQAMAAKAADDASRIVLRETQPTALVCQNFREQMGFILGDALLGLIPGTRVTRFTMTNIPRKTFP